MSPSEGIVVRQVLKADFAKLAALDHSSSTDHVWQLELRRDPRGSQIAATFREVRLPRPVRLTYPNDPTALAAEAKLKAMIYVAAAQDQPVGYIALTEPRGALAWITDLAVAPRLRRKGIAGMLLGQAKQWAAERGCRQIFLETQAKNYPAIMLAQKHGYEFCGYNDRYYSSQEVSLAFVRGV